MLKSIEVTGKTEDEAVASALAQLGLDRDDVQVEIVERAKSGFLGLGSSPAVVKVSYEAEELEEPEIKQSAKAAPSPAVTPEAGSKEAQVESFVRGLLEHMGAKADIEVSPRENGGLSVRLSGDNMGAIIGRRGETLDAIQHLANYAVNRGSEKRLHINVDAENYRSKREESLVHLARKMADKAVKYHRSMTLEPMNSYERHIIHTALQDYEGVSTSSTGTEPNRRVVVSCDKAQNPANGGGSNFREWS